MAIPTEADASFIDQIHTRFSQELVIDKHKLDEELCTQADKFRQICDALAMAYSYAAATKDEFTQHQAELETMVREDHEREHAADDKPPRLTDKAVMAKVMTESTWIAAKEAMRKWDDLTTRLQGLKESWAQRSSMLKELPTLFAAGYWQGPTAYGQNRAERERDLVAAEASRRRDALAGVPERRRPRIEE